MNSNSKAFIEGIADIVYQPEISLKRNSNFEKDDYKALKSDWEKVGNDIRSAIKEYSKCQKVGK